LHDQHDYQRLAEELRMLLKVRDYFRLHPDAEGRIRPHFVRCMESDDPEVRERLSAGAPFDQIELPPEPLPAAWAGEEDREVVEYLRHNKFSLGPRLAVVCQAVDRLMGSAGDIACPRCRAGRLHVPPECWDEFTAGEATST
jgi:hypothetical protein